MQLEGRRVWIQAQAMAMADRISFEAALERMLVREQRLQLEALDED